MVKATFTLDDETIRTIRLIAERRKKPQSSIVREAVAAYAREEEKLDDSERARRLQLIDELTTRPPTRTPDEVDAELRGLRHARRTGWRRPHE